MKRKPEKGRRLTVWVPNEDLWIFNALEMEVRIEENLGVRSSRGNIALRIIKSELMSYYDPKAM